MVIVVVVVVVIVVVVLSYHVCIPNPIPTLLHF